MSGRALPYDPEMQHRHDLNDSRNVPGDIPGENGSKASHMRLLIIGLLLLAWLAAQLLLSWWPGLTGMPG
jgi:hypothetical protein